MKKYFNKENNSLVIETTNVQLEIFSTNQDLLLINIEDDKNKLYKYNLELTRKEANELLEEIAYEYYYEEDIYISYDDLDSFDNDSYNLSSDSLKDMIRDYERSVI